MNECPCFYCDEDQIDICVCGHHLDEHDETLNCKAEDVDQD